MGSDEPDLDEIANACQSILMQMEMSDVSPQTVVVVESRLQEIWAEVNNDVTELDDMDRIYPDR